MDRMKTFFIYFLIFVGFFVMSNMLENGLIYDMYKKINGEINNNLGIEVIDNESRATIVNGYMNLSVKNNLSSNLESRYMKLDLYNKQDLLALTEYVDISGLKENELKDFQLKFNANNIEKYKISVVNEKPDTSGVIRILGFDINLGKYLAKLGIDPTNVFGIDLTSLTWDKVKEGGKTAWNFALNFVKSLPTWAYVIASGIVLWNLPAGFLFFL